MSEVLNIAEIRSRHAAEWVLLADPEVDDNMEIVRGKVLWHSKDRDEVYQKMLELRPASAATLYTGQMPEDTAIILTAP